MTALLLADDRRRLVGILGRLASDHDGERAAAGLLATRLIKARGITWEQVISAPSIAQPRPEPPTYTRTDPEPWRIAVQRCLTRAYLLTTRELEFLQDLLRWTGDLRPKQFAWLSRISAKIDAATGAAQ